MPLAVVLLLAAASCYANDFADSTDDGEPWSVTGIVATGFTTGSAAIARSATYDEHAEPYPTLAPSASPIPSEIPVAVPLSRADTPSPSPLDILEVFVGEAPTIFMAAKEDTKKPNPSNAWWKSPSPTYFPEPDPTDAPTVAGRDSGNGLGDPLTPFAAPVVQAEEDPPTEAPPPPPPPPTPDPPTDSPTEAPVATPDPTKSPTDSPTKKPTPSPTKKPTATPTSSPTQSPTQNPTRSPTPKPTLAPTTPPVPDPTLRPTPRPTSSPTDSPTAAPTRSPTTLPPVTTPTTAPPTTRAPTTRPPTDSTSTPPPTTPAPVAPGDTPPPTATPTFGATLAPTVEGAPPTTALPTTSEPTESPSERPSITPGSPTPAPTNTMIPSSSPTSSPSLIVTEAPSLSPSAMPTVTPPLQVLQASGINMTLTAMGPMDAVVQSLWRKQTENFIDLAISNVLEEVVPYYDVSVSIDLTSQDPDSRRLRRRLQRGEDLEVTFDAVLSIRSTMEEHDVNGYIVGSFDTPTKESAYISSLQSTDNSAFANLTSVEVSPATEVTAIDAPNTGNEDPGPDIATIAIIVGLAVVGVAGMGLVGFFVYTRRRKREKQSPPTPVEVESDNHYGDEIEVDEKDDVSTLGDPIPPGMRSDFIAEDPTAFSATTDSLTADYDFQKAYRTGQVSVVESHTESDPSTVLSKDDVTLDAEYITQHQHRFEVQAPAGLLGLVLETSDEGVPVVHAIKETSVLAGEVQVGDRLVSVDDQDVTSMLASSVSRLISSKKENPVRTFVFTRPMEK